MPHPSLCAQRARPTPIFLGTYKTLTNSCSFSHPVRYPGSYAWTCVCFCPGPVSPIRPGSLSETFQFLTGHQVPSWRLVSNENKFKPSKERLYSKGLLLQGQEGTVAVKAGGHCHREDALTGRSVSISGVQQREFSFMERRKQGWKSQVWGSGMKKMPRWNRRSEGVLP